MHTTWWLWTYAYIHGMITISKVLNISIIFQNFLVFLCAYVLSGRSPNMRSMLSTCYFWCMKRWPYFQRSRPLHHIPTWSRTTCSKTIFALVDFDVLSFFLAWRIPGMAEPGGLLSLGSHRVGHDWSNLAVAAAIQYNLINLVISAKMLFPNKVMGSGLDMKKRYTTQNIVHRRRI